MAPKRLPGVVRACSSASHAAPPARRPGSTRRQAARGSAARGGKSCPFRTRPARGAGCSAACLHRPGLFPWRAARNATFRFAFRVPGCGSPSSLHHAWRAMQACSSSSAWRAWPGKARCLGTGARCFACLRLPSPLTVQRSTQSGCWRLGWARPGEARPSPTERADTCLGHVATVTAMSRPCHDRRHNGAVGAVRAAGC